MARSPIQQKKQGNKRAMGMEVAGWRRRAWEVRGGNNSKKGGKGGGGVGNIAGSS